MMFNRILKKQLAFLPVYLVIISTLVISAATIFATTTDDGSPNLNISKSANFPSNSLVKPGDVIKYTLTYSNNGTGQATNVLIADPLPANTSFVSASDGGTLVGSVVRWNSIGTLASGAEGSVTLEVKVNSSAANGAIISNQAGIDSDQSPPLHSGIVRHRVHFANVVLSIEKSANPVSGSTVKEEDNITYTLSYKNTGNWTATGVIITDSLPSNTSFVQASDGGTLKNGVVNWSIGTISPGAGSSVTLTVKVNSALANGTVINNQASIVSNETSIVNSSIVTHTVTKETSNPPQVTPNNLGAQGAPSDAGQTINSSSPIKKNEGKKTLKSKAITAKKTSKLNDKNDHPGNNNEFPRTDISESAWPFIIYLVLAITMLLMLVYNFSVSRSKI